MLKILFLSAVIPLGLWMVISLAIWIWYFTVGKNKIRDPRFALAIMLIPIYPFIYIFQKILRINYY